MEDAKCPRGSSIRSSKYLDVSKDSAQMMGMPLRVADLNLVYMEKGKYVYFAGKP